MATRTRLCTQISKKLAQYWWLLWYICSLCNEYCYRARFCESYYCSRCVLMNQISPGVWWSLQSWLPQYLGHSQGTFLTCNKIFLCFSLIHFDSLYPLFDPKLIWNDYNVSFRKHLLIQKNSLIITNLKYFHLWLQFFYIKIHILFNYANYDCHRLVFLFS